MNWFEKDKFEKILAIIYSNKFNYKNKMGEFKYIDIRDLVNNIRNNTISEISAKKGLNKLNKIKNAGIIKYKKRTPKQKELLNLFNDLLDTILTDKILESESQEDKNENEKVESRKVENKKQENEKVESRKVESRKEENEDEDENKNVLLKYIEDVDDKLFKNTVKVKILIVLLMNLIMQQIKKIKKK